MCARTDLDNSLLDRAIDWGRAFRIVSSAWIKSVAQFVL